ncbi:MAG: glycosyltransferase [Nanobdellota archaeon]
MKKNKFTSAVIHNYLDNIGGAELVTYTIATKFGSDIYTSAYEQDNAAKLGFKDVKVYKLGLIPKQAPFKQQLALFWSRLYTPKKKYNIHLITGDWAIGAAKRAGPTLWYAHSPPRELWDLYEFTRQHNMRGVTRWIFDVWVWLNRKLTRQYVKDIDRIVCNSENVRKRIKKYFGREAKVIHPPVDTDKFYNKPHKGFWLSVNRYVRHKRIELQLEAFRKMPETKLVIVANEEKSHHFRKYREEIKRQKPENVTILNRVSDAKLKELYATCTGFITTSKEEDFGLTAVEAMSAGKPVIAPAKGGYLESVVDGKTGRLIKNITPEKIRNAIREIAPKTEKYKRECLKQAKRFDVKEFVKHLEQEIHRTMQGGNKSK